MIRKIILAVSVILVLSSTAQSGDGLRVLTEKNPPFNFIRDGRPTGFSTAIVRRLLARLDLPDDIQLLPWARAYRQALDRPNVILFSTARTPQREDLFYWVGPLYKVRFGFYARKNSSLCLYSLEDARKVKTIATYRHDVREQLLLTRGFTNIERSKSAVSGLKKLVSGRVDLWLHSDVGAPWLARSVGIDFDQIKLVLPFEEIEAYIAISRKTPPHMVKQWRAALAAIKRDGSFYEISRQWLPAESIPPAHMQPLASPKMLSKLKIFTENSPPANFMKGGKLGGLSVAIVREIVRRCKMPDSIQMVPWARGYTLALTQPDVALFSTTRLPQREKLFKWVGPLYSQTWGFYGKKGAGLKITSLEQAKKVARIGTYHKDAKEQYLLAQGFTNLVSTNKNLSNIRHLLRGTIDLWVSSDFNMPYLVKQAGINPDRIERVYAFKKVENYIAFSTKTSDCLIHRWQRQLDEIKRDGTYERLRGGQNLYGMMLKRKAP